MSFSPVSKKDLGLLKRASQYIKPYKVAFIGAFLCILSGIGFGLIQPMLWAKILTSLFAKSFHQLSIILLMMTMAYAAQTLVSLLNNFLFTSLNEKIIYDIKRDMYHKILNVPVKAFDDMSVGEFMSRLNGDASGIASIITNQFLNTLVAILKVFIIGGVVFFISVPLALVVIGSFPLLFLVFLLFGKKLRQKNSEFATLNDQYFGNMQESLSGIREIKSLGIKSKNLKVFLSLGNKIKGKKINIGVLGSVSEACAQSIQFATQAVLMLVGFYLILKGSLTVEYFIAFTAYSEQFTDALLEITKLNSSIQQALISMDRIFHLMDNLDYSLESFGPLELEKIDGDISIENLCFGYGEDKQVLDNISLRIPANRKTAIVGSSGSGKSTLFNLLLRFYSPVTGKIAIDGINIDEMNETSLRKHISVVRQEPFLFHATIKENLLLAKPEATLEEVVAACKQAYIHEYIRSLPLGYDTVVEGAGSNLSGGQKQRIAIARALLKASRIILFDEATSSLDNESQSNIIEAIDKLSKSHTVIIIAHRLLTVIDADEIIVMEKGKIVGQGSHNVLINNNETYKSLYRNELDIIEKNQEEAL